MKTNIFETEAEAASYAAEIAVKILSEKPDALFCLAPNGKAGCLRVTDQIRS